MRNRELKYSVLAICACLLWSTAFVGIKIGLQYTTPLQFAGLRFFLSGIMLLPLIRPFSQITNAIRHNLWLIIKVSAFQTFVLYALFYWGIDLIDGALAAIIIGSQPLFAALTAHVMMKNDKMTIRKMLTISTGIAGIVLIAIPKGLDGPDGWLGIVGIALLILANITSGIGNVFVSQHKKSISPIILSSLQMIIGGLLLFCFSLLFEPFTGFSLPSSYFLALGWLSFLSATAFTIWFYLLQKPTIKVSDLNIFKFIIPIVGAALSWLILPDESPNITSIVGMLIIGSSVIFYNLASKN